VFSPVSLFPWKWSFQNMKHTPHPYQLRRRFLRVHWFRCAINNKSNIILTAFSITMLQKLCKVMPHTALQGLMMAFTKSLACIIFGGRTEYLKSCAHLTNFRNISLGLYSVILSSREIVFILKHSLCIIKIHIYNKKYPAFLCNISFWNYVLLGSFNFLTS
jgi:hypothetical protein